MAKTALMATTLAATALIAAEARASTVLVDLTGPGVGGSLTLTYGTATDPKYANAYEVTGISGTFSDTNNGLNIVNATVGGLVPITRDAPESANLLAPNDFSRFTVASGLSHGDLTFDNLFWPGGSPPTATGYDPHGGFLDIYGLMFTIGGGRVVNFWSNGVFDGGPADYGLGVATSSIALDYLDGGVSATATAVPEPGSFWLLGCGLLGMAGALGMRNRGLAAATLTQALLRQRKRLDGGLSG